MSAQRLRIPESELAAFTARLDRFTSELPAELAICRRSMEQALEQMERYQRQATTALAAAERLLDSAERSWNDCLSSDRDDDCSDLAGLVERRQAQRARARANLQAVEERTRQVRAATERVRGETDRAIRFVNSTGRDVTHSLDQMLVSLGHASQVRARLANGTQAAQSPARGGGPLPLVAANARLPGNTVMFPLSRVPASELDGIDEHAFNKMPLPEMREATELLFRRVIPLCDSGATRDDLQRLDQREGRLGPVTLARTYDLFFGNDPIKIDLAGSQPSVIGGRHRIWVAQRMGIPALPVRARP